MPEKDQGKSARGPRGTPTTPEDYPTTPQASYPSGEYSYVLEIVMNMQVTMGKLTEAVDTLKNQSKEHGQKLEKISHTIYGATAVVTVIGGIAIFLLNKIWDAALVYFKPH